MLWPTNSQKQLFDNNMDSMELHLNLVSNLSIFLQYRVLALCTQRAITGRLLEVYLGLTLKHLTRKERLSQKKLLLVKLIWSSFTPVPYWLMAWQVYFPALSRLMVAVFVVFTSTVEFRISAVYMGGVPLAEHDSMPPCIAN